MQPLLALLNNCLFRTIYQSDNLLQRIIGPKFLKGNVTVVKLITTKVCTVNFGVPVVSS